MLLGFVALGRHPGHRYLITTGQTETTNLHRDCQDYRLPEVDKLEVVNSQQHEYPTDIRETSHDRSRATTGHIRSSRLFLIPISLSLGADTTYNLV